MRKLTMILSLFAFLEFICFAQNARALDLSLNEAVEKIVQESQDIKKAEANVKKAEASLRVANSNRWPNIEGSATYMNLVNVEQPGKSYVADLPPELGGIIAMMLQGMTGNPTANVPNLPKHILVPDNIFTTGVSITQPIYTFGKIGNAVKAVKSAIKMSKAGEEMARREVIYAANNIYWTAKMTDEIVKISQKDLNSAVQAKKNLTSAGRANRLNLVKIESDIAAKKISLSDAEFNRDTAHRMLKILAGIDINEKVNLTDSFPDKFVEMKKDELKSTPQWDVLSEQANLYETNARAQRAGGYPTLAATASYSYTSMARDFEDAFDKNHNQSAYWGVALKVPIFSGGLHRANATIEAMNAEAARQDLDKSKKTLSEEYERAIDQYNHLRGDLEGLENARNLAQKAYNFSRDRFAAGQTSAVELSEVSAGLYKLDIALLNAKYQILMSEQSVKKLGE